MQYLKIRKKSFILLVSYLCAAIAVLFGFIGAGTQKSASYRRIIDAGYMRAFSELSSSVNELDMSLQKVLYSSSPSMMSSLCSNIFGKANAAQSYMAELPFSDYALENASAFIARTGDYALALDKLITSGEGLTNEQYENLKKLSDAASILSQNLMEMQSELENGTMRISDIGQADSNLSNGFELVGERFQLIENEFPEIPSLVYDGPFSQHIRSSKPKMLENQDEVSQNEALKIAADFIGLNEADLSQYYESDGEIPLHCFSTADGSSSISLTKQGGKVYNMSKYREIGYTALDSSEAVEAAKNFLSEHGFADLKESYWTLYDNVVLINFAATQDGCVLYPDLIKASVSLDTGEIVGFEAAGYIFSHTERELPEAKISRDDAEAKISDSLTVLSYEMCVIPTSGKHELLCHEFKCENESGNHYLIYINAVSGNEEKIMCLIEDDNGTLTM